MPSEDEEARADRLYAALDWVWNQAELVTYLLSRYNPVLAHSVVQGVLTFVGQFSDWDAAQLQQTYLAGRRATEQQYRKSVA